MRISELKAGDAATVVGFDARTPPSTVDRFRALGFVVGTALVVERRLPFGGPMVVRLGGSAFSLEPEAAAFIDVTRGGPS